MTTRSITTEVHPPDATNEPIARIKHIPWYQGRLWHGMNLGGWTRLMMRNHFAVSPSRLPMAVMITFFAACNTLLAWLEWALYARDVARTAIDARPVFILGHWRTGTTLLHELLAQDPRHTFPTNYASFAAEHFLLTEGVARRFLWFLLPTERPMDRMRMGFDLPQEDEAALCNLGLPSPFLTVAFPNRSPQDPRYVDLGTLDEASRRRWEQALAGFLRRVTYRRAGRLVLKSPHNTFRVRWLLKMFPDARFVYMVRDPYVLYPSTVHFWKAMYAGHGLQEPNFQGLAEHVLSTFERMHESFEASRALIPAGHLHELRYEDLVAEPLGQLRLLYERLELGDFVPAERAVLRYLADTREYRTNRYDMSMEERETIARRWRDYFLRHGYSI